MSYLAIMQNMRNLLKCNDALQDTFDKVTYEVIGDDSAPRYFHVDPRSGALTVARDLSKDSRTEYTVGICHDEGGIK